MRYTILIKLKDTVADPAGNTLSTALKNLGHKIENVRVGRVVQLDSDGSRDDVDMMCKTLLSNPVIEEYEIIEE